MNIRLLVSFGIGNALDFDQQVRVFRCKDNPEALVYLIADLFEEEPFCGQKKNMRALRKSIYALLGENEVEKAIADWTRLNSNR